MKTAQRMKLKQRHQLACPTFLGYPLNTKKHAANAHSRFHQSGTRKCAGGHARICRALRKYGIEGYDCPK